AKEQMAQAHEMGLVNPDDESTTLKFEWEGQEVEWEVFHKIDMSLKDIRANSGIQSRVDKQVEELMPPGPPQCVIEWVMATTYAQEKARKRSAQKSRKKASGKSKALSQSDLVKKLARRKAKWLERWLDALGLLWHQETTWPLLLEQYENGDNTMGLALGKVVANMPKDAIDPYRQFDRDRIAGEHESILRTVTGIYVAVDKDWKVLAFMFPKALDYFYNGPEIRERVDADLTSYAYYEPPFQPDPQRHRNNKYWIKQNPHFAKPNGVHGTYHMGCWQVQGHGNDPIVETHDSLPDHVHVARLQKELMRGAMAVLTQPVSFLYGVVDPQDRAEFVDVQQKTFLSAPVADDDPFTLRAWLHNVKTESHLDSGDWIKGLAFLATTGAYEGGNLCIKALGIQLEYPAGSIAALRGRDLVHYTTSWSGSRRNCVVHTSHQSVRQDAYEEGQGELGDDAHISEEDSDSAPTSKKRSRGEGGGRKRVRVKK
ncbi:MAG: hypothetical protein M1830_006049, partial [Pleopsidium flavum]